MKKRRRMNGKRNNGESKRQTYFTKSAVKSLSASTRKRIDRICASTAIETRIGSTFIDVSLTQDARVTRDTRTREEIDRICAVGTILTRH
jgi:hypothetical protein